MKAFFALVALFIGVNGEGLAPFLHDDAKEFIPGEYIIQLQEEADLDQHLRTVRYYSWSIDNSTRIMNTFAIGKLFKGYGIRCGEKVLNGILAMEGVDHAEPNQIYKASQASCNLQTGATWGIVRTTYRDLPSESDYSYSPNDEGEGVDAYIVDTGIETTHPDFGGRAIWGVDFIDNPSPETDLNGHGTHVAGTVMSNTWGLAKRATSIAVRVLDQNGSGSTVGVIGGIDWVAGQHSPGKKSILNMSLGGGKSTTMNAAADAAVEAGVIVVVAAGNEGQDACNVSPASAEKVITVGATDKDDEFAYFSNYGSCEDISGPGMDITSTWLNGGTNTISGTSMASPHVAGVIAKYLIDPSMSPAVIEGIIKAEATEDKIKGLPPNSFTPNLLIFKSCEPQ